MQPNPPLAKTLLKRTKKEKQRIQKPLVMSQQQQGEGEEDPQPQQPWLLKEEGIQVEILNQDLHNAQS